MFEFKKKVHDSNIKFLNQVVQHHNKIPALGHLQESWEIIVACLELE